MSSLSQFIGSQTIIGESVEMYGGVPYFVEGTKEFLKTGTLKAYSATYAAYVARCPYASYIDVTPNNTVSLTNAQNGGIFWDGTRYLNIGWLASGGQLEYWYSTNLTSWTANHQTFDNTVTNDVEHQNGITVIAGIDTTNRFRYKIAAAATFTPAGPAGNAALVVGNAAGTLWVSPGVGVSTNSAGIYTSTNLTTWTNRTGTGGTSMNFGGAFWCPCASAFYFMGPLGANLYLNKTTDGFTQTVSVANDTTFAPLNTWHKNIVASSPTVTIILGTNGTIKRTTDGTTWTTIDLKTQNVAGISASKRIYYNSVHSKFYIQLTEYTQSGVVSLMSSSDGLTWNQVYAIRDAGTTGAYAVSNINGIWVANSKVFMRHDNGSASNYASSGIFDVTNDIAQATPDWVGNASAIANKFVRIA